ncbi:MULTISPECIES: hypothetical protein [unclassified Brevibacterium]
MQATEEKRTADPTEKGGLGSEATVLPEA